MDGTQQAKRVRKWLGRQGDRDPVDALWNCSGVAEGRYAFYCVTLLAKSRRQGVLVAELRATTPVELAALLREAGLVPPAIGTIRRRCESASSNPALFLPRRHPAKKSARHCAEVPR